MLIQRAYKFRLKPNEQQMRQLAQVAGCQRFIWNLALAYQKSLLDQGLPVLHHYKLIKQYYEWRQTYPFLQESIQESVNHTHKYLYFAFRDGFKQLRRFPKFKVKSRKDSFRCGFSKGQGQCKLDESNHCIYIPKIGWVKYFKNRKVEGVVKNATISYQSGHWFVSLQVEVELPEPVHPSHTAVGIDVGISKMAVLSDGTVFEPLNSMRKQERRLIRTQKRLSRKQGPNKLTGQKASQNWKKQKRKLLKIHTQIADARNDYLHKVTTTISKQHAVIYIEDLKVSNMSASAQGTVDAPGKNIKQKSGLNKAILDQGWYEFRRQLEYKQSWKGGQ